MNNKILIIVFASLSILASCNTDKNTADAYGNFEAEEIMVPAEATGKLLTFDIIEGATINKGQQICTIDNVQLNLKKEQLQALQQAVSSKVSNIESQINVQLEQRKTIEREFNRLKNLLKDGAATQQQVDDISGKMSVIDKQIESIKTQNSAVLNELESYTKQIEQIDDQIERSVVKSPIDGTVLEKYCEIGEMAMQGKTLFKIANINHLNLRAYISGAQLSSIKIGQEVNVKIDNGKDDYNTFKGTITWISAQAEFTPKIIQTKEERVNLVYAIKVLVKNDGSIKIGMPGEVRFK